MSNSASIDHLLTDAAAPHDGFVVTPTLREIGITKRRAQSCRDRGRLHPIVGDVCHVALRREQLSPRQWMRARLLAAGEGAALTRIAVFNAAGDDRFGSNGHLHIVVPRRRGIILPDTTIHVVSDLRPEDVSSIDGMRVTSSAWTCAELGRDFTDRVGSHQLANALHRIEYRDRTTTLADQVEEELERRRHVGSPVVRAGLDLYRSNSIGTRGRTEDRYVEMALAAHRPAPLVNTVHGLFGRTVEIDIYYVRERVRVEIKGGQHGRNHDRAVDHVRDVDFTDLGITVMSEDWRVVWRDLAGCRRRLLRTLGR